MPPKTVCIIQSTDGNFQAAATRYARQLVDDVDIVFYTQLDLETLKNLEALAQTTWMGLTEIIVLPTKDPELAEVVALRRLGLVSQPLEGMSYGDRMVWLAERV